MTDADLWKNIKKGDKKAFELLYHRYYSSLFAYAHRFRFDDDTIKDCLQELFIRIYIKRSELPELSSVKPYLFRSLINSLLDTAKNIRNNNLALDELDLFIEDDGFVMLFSNTDEKIEQVQLLQKALKQLSSKQKHALYLRFIQEFSWQELSQVFGMSSHSCMNLVGRAIFKLRKIMNL